MIWRHLRIPPIRTKKPSWGRGAWSPRQTSNFQTRPASHAAVGTPGRLREWQEIKAAAMRARAVTLMVAPAGIIPPVGLCKIAESSKSRSRPAKPPKPDHNRHLYENNSHAAKTLFVILYTQIGGSCFARMRAFRASLNTGLAAHPFFAI